MRLKELWIEHDQFCREMTKTESLLRRSMSGLAIFTSIALYALMVVSMESIDDSPLAWWAHVWLAMIAGLFGLFLNFAKDPVCDSVSRSLRNRRFNQMLKELNKEKQETNELSTN